MQGQILGNRYELLEKIGGGGMANVYKAKCRKLNRFVAIKILRNEYINDDEFVKRFLIEAQSAASLSHPNIVSIYDVGHENNTHYIVMELINGVTLKEYINKKGKLLWRDAVNIAIQICSAIEHAHRNNIVHRDIKPHNILLTEEGIAKVTDFGIARAVTSSTITMVGTTIGSVHYFSPEQARGGYVDEKSDIYSLGIALYEMTTGVIPFDGETPVAVALKHLQVEAVPPMEINPDISPALNDIILKAMKKEQQLRYQTASDMLNDLYIVLENPAGNFVKKEVLNQNETKRMEAINPEKYNLTEIYPSRDGGSNNSPMSKNKNNRDKNKDKKTVIIAVATSLVIIMFFTIMTIMMVSPSAKGNSSIEVQDYRGEDIDDVRSLLEGDGIQVKETRAKDKTQKDLILSQSIEPGKTLKQGGYIEFTVSDGPEKEYLPDVSKMEYRAAVGKLADLGFDTKLEEEFHDTIPVGYVIKSDPAGDGSVDAGSVITLFKSKGPAVKEVPVPDLLGKEKKDAIKALTDVKLMVGNISPAGVSSETAKVTWQEPAAGTAIKEGSHVNITLETPSPSPTPKAPEKTPEPDEKDLPASGGQNKMSDYEIRLTNPEIYSDVILVRVEIVPSDTNKMQVLFEGTAKKSEFPMILSVPLANKGKTRVLVYLNNVLYSSDNLQ